MKRYWQAPGYVCERANPHVPRRTNHKIVVLCPSKQTRGADDAGGLPGRPAIVAPDGMELRGAPWGTWCPHGALIGVTSERKARDLMKRPEIFCSDCNALAHIGTEVVVDSGPDTFKVEVPVNGTSPLQAYRTDPERTAEIVATCMQAWEDLTASAERLKETMEEWRRWCEAAERVAKEEK